MAEDFNKLRLLSRQLGQIDFKLAWQFRLEIEPIGGLAKAPPEDFDFYVKDVSFDPVGITTDSETIGAHTWNWPRAAETVTVSMTMRDHADCRISKWFSDLAYWIVAQDGTVRMAKEFALKITRYAILPNMSEKEVDSWDCFPTKMGPVTESRAEPGHLEFPITFTQITTFTPSDKANN